MTEEEIERRVKKMTDHLYACLTAGVMRQRDYNKAMQDLHRWAQARRRGYRA